MKKTKSKAAYTNKWLNRNKHLWCDKAVNGEFIIVLKAKDAPKIVKERVEEINKVRRVKNYTIGRFLSAIEMIGRK